ncbi:5-oxoprolinase subunit C family protein [Clostridium felsineum]|uniref:5-oxoprolinase subunit C n=1 Tax=Clostridium felsineum TaxID=36839 RepID=A0A1S8MGK7_9CLOT|nr:biotin-dependent carboxyltransferase family protein [Clostridium felsineum]URZ07850.1 5-oxoprolinase subunit C [Clostridium felsineum]URZ12881.1 5-oxoprolinase subunit C [Clostridium felsineum]
MKIEVLKSGLLTTVQDIGRYGFQNQGILVSGAMDIYAMRLSNILVGNDENEGVIEVTLMGPQLRLEKGTLLAITGGDLSPTLDNEPVSMYRPIYLKKDSILKFGAVKSGCRSYIAFAGGMDLKKVLESKSTYLRGGIGGFKGRALKNGDIININKEKSKVAFRIIRGLKDNNNFKIASWYVKKEKLSNELRVVRGVQFDLFNKKSREDFFASDFEVTPSSDRMGYRLIGKKLSLKKEFEMLSEAISLGAVQVPRDGNPIILLADRQTTGGYPKIAQVVQVDLYKIAQMKPKAKISFKEISLEEAEKLYFQREKYIRDVKMSIGLN